MGRFASLLKPFVVVKTGDWEKDKEAFAAPGRNQRDAAAALPSLVSESGLHWWTLNDAVPHLEIRLVIGVAAWSNYDLRLLDDLAEAVPILVGRNIRIEIFDVDAWGAPGDFNQRIPGIEDTKVFQSPIVGVWRDGELREKASGYKGRELVYDFLHSITGRDLRPR